MGQPQPADQLAHGIEIAGHRKRQHPAKTGHLPARNSVAGVFGQARVVHRLDPRVRFEEFGHGLGIAVLPLHAKLERLQAAAQQERRHRIQRRAVDFAKVEDLPDQRAASAHDPAHRIGMSAEELGRAVDDQVRAQPQGLLVYRSCEGIVDHHDRAGCMRFGRQALDVDDLQRRVGRAFQIKDVAALVYFRLDRVEVGRVAQRHIDAEARQELDEQFIGAAISIFDRNHPLARRQQREQRIADRGHPGGKTGRVFRVFEQPHSRLEVVDGRVGVARIHVAGLFAPPHGGPFVQVVVGERHAVEHRHHRHAFRGNARPVPPHAAGRRTQLVFKRILAHRRPLAGNMFSRAYLTLFTTRSITALPGMAATTIDSPRRADLTWTVRSANRFSDDSILCF